MDLDLDSLGILGAILLVGFLLGGFTYKMTAKTEQEIYDKLANGRFKKEIKSIEFKNGNQDTTYTLIKISK